MKYFAKGVTLSYNPFIVRIMNSPSKRKMPNNTKHPCCINIQELVSIIDGEKQKRDYLKEYTPANKQLFLEKCAGTFEAVEMGNGTEKCLIPQVGTLMFLFRGQNQEFIPCLPSLYRLDNGKERSEAEIFVDRMRLVVFKRLLNSYPVIKYFFKRHNFRIDEEGLAQHYGINTSVLDLTSNLDIALFFATCWYDGKNDCYHPYDDNKIHEAVLYVFLPLYDNETMPGNVSYLNNNIRPIGLQAFPRPGAQEGYGLHLGRGKSTKSYLYRFTFTCEDSRYYYEKFKAGESLWIKDKFVDKVKCICHQTEFSFDVFNETFRSYRPRGYSGTSLKKSLPPGITIKSKVPDVVFSDSECGEVIADWNTIDGPDMASKIFRKRWYNYESKETLDDGREQLKGIHDEHDFRSLERASIRQYLVMVGCPDAMEGAEWKVYYDTPVPKNWFKESDGWVEVPASMEDLYGEPYLEEKDWIINELQ